jgi:hypothetical protein
LSVGGLWEIPLRAVEKGKRSQEHQHANKVKEIQLSPSIDPHDFGVKLSHAIDFLCEEMKVKVTLRFRGREMAHKEFGFQQVQKFIKEITPYGHPDADPKLIGKGIVLMLSPLPRNKRAKNPHGEGGHPPEPGDAASEPDAERPKKAPKKTAAVESSQPAEGGFSNNPFSELENKVPH